MKINQYGLGLSIDTPPLPPNWVAGIRDISHLLKGRLSLLPRYTRVHIRIHGALQGGIIFRPDHQGVFRGCFGSSHWAPYPLTEWGNQSVKSFIRMMVKKSNLIDRSRLLKILG